MAKASYSCPAPPVIRRGMQSKIDRLDGKLVEQDIAARRQEALIGYRFAQQIEAVEAALKSVKSNLNVDQWRKQTAAWTSARCGDANGSTVTGKSSRPSVGWLSR